MFAPLWLMLAIVFIAGAMGALIRHAATVLGTPHSLGVRRRITTINTVGAFCAGALVAIDHPVAPLITVGLFGSLTTFSTIAVWLAHDIRQRKAAQALTIVLSHVLLGVLAVLAGFLIGQTSL